MSRNSQALDGIKNDPALATLAAKLEEMSEEQLEAKMKQILDDYAPLLNLKTVEGESQDINESELSSSHKKLETPIVPKSE